MWWGFLLYLLRSNIFIWNWHWHIICKLIRSFWRYNKKLLSAMYENTKCILFYWQNSNICFLLKNYFDTHVLIILFLANFLEWSWEGDKKCILFYRQICHRECHAIRSWWLKCSYSNCHRWQRSMGGKYRRFHEPLEERSRIEKQGGFVTKLPGKTLS